jgi:hypothetical protein
MRRLHSIVIVLLLSTLLLTGCGSPPPLPTSTPPPPTATPDPCSSEYIKDAAAAVNQFMREFDDSASLASSVPRNQLAPHISVLQGIRRRAQDQGVPRCLVQLKQLQLIHMNTVINTLLTFLGRGDESGVVEGIGLAREQHDEYTLELARLAGVTPSGLSASPAIESPLASTPESTGTASTVSPPAGSEVRATNPGPLAVNLRGEPHLDAEPVGTLAPGGSVAALATSADGQWLQVVLPEDPEATAWVLAADVQLGSGSP